MTGCLPCSHWDETKRAMCDRGPQLSHDAWEARWRRWLVWEVFLRTLTKSRDAAVSSDETHAAAVSADRVIGMIEFSPWRRWPASGLDIDARPVVTAERSLPLGYCCCTAPEDSRVYNSGKREELRERGMKRG